MTTQREPGELELEKTTVNLGGVDEKDLDREEVKNKEVKQGELSQM